MSDDLLTTDRIRRRIGAKLDLPVSFFDKAAQDRSARRGILARLRRILINTVMKNSDVKG